MRTIENFPTDLSVAKPVAVVRVGGFVLANVGGVTVTRGSGTAGLPSTLVDGGTSRATAEFTVNPASGKRSVWPSGTPARGTSVTIDTGYEGATARRFTGVVDYSEGGVGEAATVHCIDLSDRLRHRTRFDPLLWKFPSSSFSSYRPGLCPGLSSTYFVAEAARRSGFDAGPPPVDWSTTRMFAPLNGGAWVQSGRLEKANRMNGSTPEERHRTLWYRDEVWGSGAASLWAKYATTNVVFPEAGYRARPSAGAPLRFQFMVGHPRPAQSGYSRMFVSWPNGANINIGVHPTNDYVGVSLSNGRTVPALAAGAGDVVEVTVEVDGTVTVSTEGQSRSSSGELPSGMTTSDAVEVELRIPETGRSVAYLTLWNSASIIGVNFTQTAILDGLSSQNQLEASPTIDQRSLDLIEEITAAEVSAAWLDEDGRLVLRSRSRMEATVPGLIMTAEHDLAPYSWKEEWGSSRSEVEVGWERTSVEVAFRFPSVTVFTGGGDTRKASDGSADEFIGPEEREEWISVSLPLRGFTATSDDGLPGFPLGFQDGVHSWTIGTHITASEEERYEATMITCEELDPRTYLLRKGSLSRDIVMKTPTDPVNGQRLTPIWRGVDTPILRARGRSVRKPQIFEIAGGSVRDPVLEHEGGWLLQTSAGARNVAELLRAQTLRPMYTISGLSVRPDPRIQQYDRIVLRDEIEAKTEWSVIVVGYDEKIVPGTGSYTMDLDVQILSSADAGGITYGAVDESWEGNTYNQVEVENPNATYGSFENDPWKD